MQSQIVVTLFHALFFVPCAIPTLVSTQITNAFSVRDVEMDTWSCLEGWPAQGLGTDGNGDEEGEARGDILAVCRSNEEDVIAVRALEPRTSMLQRRTFRR